MLRTLPRPRRRRKIQETNSEKDAGDVERVLDQVRKSLARSKKVLEGQVQDEDGLDSSLLEKSVSSVSRRALKVRKTTPRPNKNTKTNRLEGLDQNHLEGLLASVENLLKGKFVRSLSKTLIQL